MPDPCSRILALDIARIFFEIQLWRLCLLLPGNKWTKDKMIPSERVLRTFRQIFPGIEAESHGKPRTSDMFSVPGFRGRLGFIRSMTDAFCGTCNRVRLTADGNLKVCLFGKDEVNLRDILRKHQQENRPLEE